MKRRSVFFLSIATCAACGSSGGSPAKDTEIARDTATASETETAESTEIDSESETSIPEFPDLCRRQTEMDLGMTIGQFPLSGPGSAAMPAIARQTDSNALMFAFSYIDSDAAAWAVYAAPYRTDVSTQDGGFSYTRELGDVSVLDPTEAPAKYASVIYGHDAFALIWMDGRFNVDCTEKADDTCLTDVVFLQVDADGQALGEAVRLTDTALGHPSGRPGLAATPTGYAAVWKTRYDTADRLAVVRLDLEGHPEADAFLIEDAIVDSVSSPSIAANDSSVLIAYAEAGQRGVAARSWPNDDAAPGEAVPLDESGAGQIRGAVAASSPNGFLTAWAGTVDGATQVMVRALDVSGKPAGPQQQATWSMNVGAPAVTTWDDGYAIAWTATHADGEADCAVPDWCAKQVFAARLDAKGNVVTKAVRLTEDPNESRNVQIAYDGNGLTAVYETWRRNRWQLYYSQMTCE